MTNEYHGYIREYAEKIYSILSIKKVSGSAVIEMQKKYAESSARKINAVHADKTIEEIINDIRKELEYIYYERNTPL